MKDSRNPASAIEETERLNPPQHTSKYLEVPQGLDRHACLRIKVAGKWEDVPHETWVEIPEEYITWLSILCLVKITAIKSLLGIKRGEKRVLDKVKAITQRIRSTPYSVSEILSVMW